MHPWVTAGVKLRCCRSTHYSCQPLPRGHVHDLHGDFLAAAALCLPSAGTQVWAGDDVGVVHQVTVLWGFLQTQFHPAIRSQHLPGSSGQGAFTLLCKEGSWFLVPAPQGAVRYLGLGKIKAVLRQSQAQGHHSPTDLCEDIEGGPATLPRLQRPQQRALVHDATAGTVHHLHATAALGKSAVVQEPCGRRVVSRRGLPQLSPELPEILPSPYLWWRAAAACAL